MSGLKFALSDVTPFLVGNLSGLKKYIYIESIRAFHEINYQTFGYIKCLRNLGAVS